ncbi:MAG: glycosyltransferase, partial [Pseudonocardia sp.]|nr:glycosyltransferase [Pseudonocardia sp.]
MDSVAAYGDALGVVTAAPVPDAFLTSLSAATVRPLRVVAVGGGAVGGAGPERDGVQTVRVSEQLARAAAVNRGVVALPPGVGWVVVADPQVRWGAAAIDTLLAAAARHPRAGALGARLRRAGGGVLACAGAVPGRRDLLRGRVPLGAPRSTGRVGWVSATCMLLRRTALDSVDGLDPRHLGPVDGVDLGDRLGRAGWLVLHVPSAEVVVEAGGTLLESARAGLRSFAR